MDLLQYYLL